MVTLISCLALVAAQTPAPAKPIAPAKIPVGVIVAPDVLPEAMQWKALASTARLTGSTGELGTAVVVGIREGSAYLLTANHVVTDNAERKLEFFTKENDLTKPELLSVTEMPVFRAPQIDIAIVKVNPGKAKLTVMPVPQPGKKSRPNRFPAMALSIGCSKGATPTCRNEEIVGKVLVRKSNTSGSFFWLAKVPSIEGRSGGPLIKLGDNNEPSLIGICSANQNNQGFYTHLDEIHAALKLGGYSWIWESNKTP